MVKGQITINLNGEIFQTFIDELTPWKNRMVVRVPKTYSHNISAQMGEYLLPVFKIESKSEKVYEHITLDCWVPEKILGELIKK